MKKIACACLVSILSLSVLTGCGSAQDNNIVNISLLNSKPEIVNAINSVIDDFTAENNHINIKTVKYSQSGSYKDKMNSLKYLDNLPTLSLIDASQFDNFKEYAADLSDEEWVKNISGGISDISKNDAGHLIAFPFSTEGTGFIYNEKVLNEAGVNPNSIHTISDLESAFSKINSTGKGALIVTNEDWSLGDHFSSILYSVDSNGYTPKKSYFESLKANPEMLRDSSALNGLLATFDLMKKYNIYASDPLTPSYDKCVEMLANGDVGFWFMGNWASKNILKNSLGNDKFGFIPVPISNNASDFGNNELSIGVTKYFIINKNSSPEQQQAAKDFLNYIAFTDRGHKFLVEDCGVITSFNNITQIDNDPLSNELIKYRDSGNFTELSTNYLPENNANIVGSAFRKYLNDEISREDLIQQIIDFWKQS